MSFNRLKYDRCEEEKTIDQSIGPGIYQVGTPVLCGSCYQDNPRIRLQKNGDSMNSGVDLRFNGGPIDIDSELKNINKPFSRCPTKKYDPIGKTYNCNNQGQPGGQGVVAGCNNVKKPGKNELKILYLKFFKSFSKNFCKVKLKLLITCFSFLRIFIKHKLSTTLCISLFEV